MHVQLGPTCMRPCDACGDQPTHHLHHLRLPVSQPVRALWRRVDLPTSPSLRSALLPGPLPACLQDCYGEQPERQRA